MTETELGAAGGTEAKAGGARDGLTDRQTDRASRPQARSSGAGAGGAPAEDGEGVARIPIFLRISTVFCDLHSQRL